MSRTLILADVVVTADGEAAGWVELDGETIAAVGTGTPDREPDERVRGTIVPGFVDIHAHGALGFDFCGGGDEGVRAIVDHHASRGSTRMMASIATAPLSTLERSVAALRPHVEDGALLGIHLEGPYLSEAHRGAHDPALLRRPDVAEVRRLLAAGGGAVRMMTIAPELDGAEAVIRLLVDEGVVVALGHTSCDAETARDAFDHGATVVTHLFNGMPGLRHRAPGLVGAALVDDRVTVELILDGHHVSAEAAEIVRRTAPGRLALVSDSMAATGRSDGDYGIGGSAVRVRDGVAMLADGSSLAGSTITVADGFRALVDRLRSPLPAAVEAAGTTAARAVGVTDAGLRPGSRADLVVLDGARVARVMRRGAWLASSS
jgi:N-acetylglucosamine-6-phosphate deacetylase